MKKLYSKHKTFSFKINSTQELEITTDGIIVEDEVASFVYNRLGDANVGVEEINIDDAVKTILHPTD